MLTLPGAIARQGATTAAGPQGAGAVGSGEVQAPAFRDAGLVPGQDIAVAGFDDIGPAVDVDPALTSVTVPPQQVGLCAMELALAISGIGAAALFPASLSMITAITTTPAARAKGLASWTTALSLGAFIAPLLSGAIVEHTDFLWAFGVTGVIAVITAVAAWLLAAESRPPGNVRSRSLMPARTSPRAPCSCPTPGLCASPPTAPRAPPRPDHWQPRTSRAPSASPAT